MPVTLLLHGVPETAAVWRHVAPLLDGDVRTPALPGFGTPVPDGFGSTMYEYLDWLTTEVEAVGEPVDLVGHDWGGILVARLALDPPANLRSWATDAPGALREGFAWHDLARVWRTPGDGEAFWDGLLADRAAAAELLAAFGLSPDHARGLIDAADETMTDCILRLYRSSDGLGTEWRAAGPTPRPGLVIAVADDPLVNVDLNRDMAERLGAELAVLERGGHFWPLEAPAAAAAALTAFVASVG